VDIQDADTQDLFEQTTQKSSKLNKQEEAQ
jgi:hypothetical protein